MFYAFIDGCCFELWCDARVTYIVNDETVMIKKYGFSDGSYMQYYKVYCNVADEEVDNLVEDLMCGPEDLHYVVVRPDVSSEDGYSVSGYIAGPYIEDEIDDSDEDVSDLQDEDDGCPHCGSHRCNIWDCQQ